MLERDGFDGFITVAPETAHYLSSVYNPVRKLIPERPALVLWPRGGEPTLVAGSIEAPLLDSRSSITDIRYYQGDTAVIAREVGRAIQDRGLSRARFGTELAAMPASLYLALAEAVPGLVLDDGGSSIGELRAIKSPAETQIMTAASQATDLAERSGLSVFEQGWTEIRLGTVLRQALINVGAETIAFLTLGGSGRGVQAHATPSTALLHPHDVLRFDMGGVFEGWCTDIAKTACIGEASVDQRRVFADLRQILDNHIGRIKAGARCADLYEAVAADFNAVGRQLRAPHVGHGIGLAVHEWPLMSADSEATLQAGMILCAELVHVHEGRERYHLEEIVSVQHGSTKVISRSSGVDTEIPVIG